MMSMVRETVVNEVATKEERRLARMKQCLVPAAVLSLIIGLYFVDFPIISKLPDIFQKLMFAGNIAIAFYAGSIFYLFKVMFLPFRIMRGFGGLGFLIAFVAWSFFAVLTLWAYAFLPVIPLLVEWFILQRTISEYGYV